MVSYFGEPHSRRISVNINLRTATGTPNLQPQNTKRVNKTVIALLLYTFIIVLQQIVYIIVQYL